MTLNFVNESHLFTQGKTIATTYTITARELSIYVDDNYLQSSNKVLDNAMTAIKNIIEVVANWMQKSGLNINNKILKYVFSTEKRGKQQRNC